MISASFLHDRDRSHNIVSVVDIVFIKKFAEPFKLLRLPYYIRPVCITPDDKVSPHFLGHPKEAVAWIISVIEKTVHIDLERHL